MLRHIVMWKFRPGTEAERDLFLTGLQGLYGVIPELKSCRVSPADLERAGCEAEGPEGEKLRDLSLICGAYDALTAQVALDPRDRLTRTAEKLKDCPWAAGRDLWLDGFTDFTPQQIEVLPPAGAGPFRDGHPHL